MKYLLLMYANETDRIKITTGRFQRSCNRTGSPILSGAIAAGVLISNSGLARHQCDHGARAEW